MKVSINWLKELVDVNVTTEELAAKFNLHSAEVEDFYKLVEATDLVVGYVTKKEKHPNADKLYIEQVQIIINYLQERVNWQTAKCFV